MTEKPWYAEREFILTVASVVVGTVLILTGSEELGQAILLTAIGGFTLSRGLAKSGDKS